MITLPNFEREVRYVLEAHRALPAAEQPVFTLLTPTAAEHAAWRNEFYGADVSATGEAVQKCDAWLARHALLVRFIQDASGFDVPAGAPGSPARDAFLNRLPFLWRDELSTQCLFLVALQETDRKNSDSPSVSAPTTGGANSNAEPAAA